MIRNIRVVFAGIAVVACGTCALAQGEWAVFTDSDFRWSLLMNRNGAQAQEKRTVFTEDSFHWQPKLATGQTLEIINRNGEIEANGSADNSAQVDATKKGNGDYKEAFIEVVEYSDGVTVCAVYAREAKPGRCHRGGVDSDARDHL